MWMICKWNKSKGKYDRLMIDKEGNKVPVFKYSAQAINYQDKVLKTNKYDVRRIGKE